MTVAELIEELRDCDPGALVILAKDAEGNGYSPLHEDYSGGGWYHPWNGYSGEFHAVSEAADPDCSYEGPGDEGASAICLWPVS